jgi:hypothetical protein
MTDASVGGASGPGLQELAALDLPSLDTAQGGMLGDCMVYALTDDTRQNLLGRTRPTLPQSVVSVITQPQQQTFLNDYCAPTLLGLGLSQNGDFSASFSPQQVAQLHYTASCLLARQPSYSVVNQAVFVPAAVASSPVLGTYADDSKNNWGQALYEYVTQPSALAAVRAEMFSDPPSRALFVRYTNLLTVLDPSGGLAQKYAGIVYYAHGVQPIAYGIDVGSPALQPYVREALPHVLDAIVTQWTTDTDPSGETGRHASAEMIQQLDAQLGDREHLVEALVQVLISGGGANDLSGRLGMVATNLPASGLLRNALQGVAGQNVGAVALTDGARVIRGVGGLAGAAALGLSFMFALSSLREWEAMTPEQKAEAAAEAVQVVGVLEQGSSFLPNILEGLSVIAGKVGEQVGSIPIPEFLTRLANAADELATRFVSWARGLLEPLYGAAASFMERLVARVPEVLRAISSRLVEAVQPILQMTRNAFAPAGKLLSALGTFARKLIKGLVIVAQAVMAALFIVDFINDIRTGAPLSKTILDGIQAVSLTELAIADVLAALTGIEQAASVSLFFVGITLVAAVIQTILLLTSSPPPTPAQVYIQNTVLPFVDKLLAAPSTRVPDGWTPGTPRPLPA